MKRPPKLKTVPSKSKKLAVELCDNDLHSLRTWAAAKKLSLEEAAAELLAFALIEHRSRVRGDNSRSQLMGESVARNLSSAIFFAVSSSKSPWLHVDYSTGKVEGADTNPGGRKGHVYLDNRPTTRVEWSDTANTLTEESVLARLLGAARPLGVRS